MLLALTTQTVSHWWLDTSVQGASSNKQVRSCFSAVIWGERPVLETLESPIDVDSYSRPYMSDVNMRSVSAMERLLTQLNKMTRVISSDYRPLCVRLTETTGAHDLLHFASDEVAYVCRCMSCFLSVVSQCLSFLLPHSLFLIQSHGSESVYKTTSSYTPSSHCFPITFYILFAQRVFSATEASICDTSKPGYATNIFLLQQGVSQCYSRLL